MQGTNCRLDRCIMRLKGHSVVNLPNWKKNRKIAGGKSVSPLVFRGKIPVLNQTISS